MSGQPTFRAIWRHDEWVKPFVARYRRVLAAALLLGLVAFLFSAALMFTSGFMISLAATVPATVLALHLPSIFVRIFGIGKPILQYLERLESHDWVLRMTSELRRKLFETVERRPRLFESRTVGEVLGLLTEDVGHIQNLYLRSAFPLAVAWLVFIAVTLFFGAFSVPVALISAVLLVVELAAVPFIAVLLNAPRLDDAKKAKARLYDEMTDNVLGLADWMFSGRREDYLHRFDDDLRAMHARDAAVRRSKRLLSIVSQAVYALLVVVVIVWAGIAFAPHDPGMTTAGTTFLGGIALDNAEAYAANWIAAFVLAVFPLIEAFSPAVDATLGAVAHKESLARLNRLSREGIVTGESDSVQAPELQDPDASSPAEESQRAVGACSEDTSVDSRAGVTDFDAASGSAKSDDLSDGAGVDLQHVSFSYPGSAKLVLDDVSLTVPAGQKVCVLGRSGAGKSTLAALIRGDIAPNAGRVLVGGADVRAWGDRISRVVGVIQQRPYLFNQTIRENLLIGRAGATDEELWEVLAQVRLTDMVRALPRGLDTLVDEGGDRFSGGERQRFALARILLAQTPVVILDEPFAGLDPATEQDLLDTIFDVLASCTVVMITHHLQGVQLADRVVFVADGHIALDGDPRVLAHDDAYFRRLLAFDRGVPGCIEAPSNLF